MWFNKSKNLMKLKFLNVCSENRLEFCIKIHDPSVIWILKTIWFNILPKSWYYFCTRFFLYTQNAGKLRTQNKSFWRHFKLQCNFNNKLSLIYSRKLSLNLNSFKTTGIRHPIFYPLYRLICLSTFKSNFHFFKEGHNFGVFTLNFTE